MRAKRAHMVSRAYLAAWANEKGLVDVADLEQERVSTTSTTNATVVRYAYETEVMNHDLEGGFAKIESAGISALAELRNTRTLTIDRRRAVVAFLDMHLERGRFADQTQTRSPAILLMGDGTTKESELNLGDRLLLSQHMKDIERLSLQGCEQWPWTIRYAGGFVTGDGAVILWRDVGSKSVCTVTFPISPTELLVIGRDLHIQLDLNVLLAMKSRRWLVGAPGAFGKDQVKVVARQHRARPIRWVPIPGLGMEFC